MRARKAATRELPEHLETREGRDPVFVMERLVSDTTGRPGTKHDGHVRADSFTYRIVSSSESEASQEMKMEAAGLFS